MLIKMVLRKNDYIIYHLNQKSSEMKVTGVSKITGKETRSIAENLACMISPIIPSWIG